MKLNKTLMTLSCGKLRELKSHLPSPPGENLLEHGCVDALVGGWLENKRGTRVKLTLHFCFVLLYGGLCDIFHAIHILYVTLNQGWRRHSMALGLLENRTKDKKQTWLKKKQRLFTDDKDGRSQPVDHQQLDDEALGLLAQAGEHALLEGHVVVADVEGGGPVVLAGKGWHAGQTGTRGERASASELSRITVVVGVE